MRKTLLSATALGALCVPLLAAAPAQAQSTRTWVSNTGADANPCSSTAPCKTFAGAFSKTAINGIINCLDTGAYGTLSITKSITVDCHEHFAGVLASGTTGFIINIAAGNANDPLRTARLRNLNVDGSGLSGTIGTRTGLNGIRIDSAALVFLEDMQVQNFTQRGLSDQRTTGGKLVVKNSTFRNNAQSGIVVLPSSGSTRIDVMLDNVHSDGNGSAGVAINNGAKAVINRSVFSENGAQGIDSEGAGAEVTVNNTVSSSNAIGITTVNGGVLRVANSDIAFNTTQAASGAWTSFGNNRLTGNTAAGTAPTAAGGATSDLGQQ
jgi:Right handed beta helix region